MSAPRSRPRACRSLPLPEKRWSASPKLLETLLTAGDDYEIVAAVPGAERGRIRGRGRRQGRRAVTTIGRIGEWQAGEVRVLGPDGTPLTLERTRLLAFLGVMHQPRLWPKVPAT